MVLEEGDVLKAAASTVTQSMLFALKWGWLMKKIQKQRFWVLHGLKTEIPIVQPEVYHRICTRNCDNEVDSDEQATELVQTAVKRGLPKG